MPKTCSIIDCNSAGQIRRGFCVKHYGWFRAHGDPGVVKSRGPKRDPTSLDFNDGVNVKLFWSKITITADPDQCWPWQGPTQNGYGVRGTNKGKRKWKFAHRLSYFLVYGKDPGDLKVLHKCDNPPCCNPNHLFLGTQLENIQDRVNKGRSNRWINKVHPRRRQSQEVS